MSTETDRTRLDEDIEHGKEWSSDEAAAAQEEMMADPHGPQGDAATLSKGWVAGEEVIPPQAAETAATGEVPGAGDGEQDYGDVVDSAAAPRHAPTADPPFPDGSVAAAYSGQNAAADALHGSEPLVADEARSDFLGRWNAIQVSFVDDPGSAVEGAYALIEEIGTALLASFTDRSSELAAEWRDAADTEQLRLALKQYRSFLGVILPK